MQKNIKISGRDSQVELAVSGLLHHHRLVFEALETANQKFGKAVLITDIISVLDKNQFKMLEKHYSIPLNQGIKSVLISLTKKRLVFVAMTERRWHSYAAISVFRQDKMPFVYKPSHRETLINILREAIIYYKRAVRVGDIETYLEEVRPDLKKNLKWFRAAVHRLVEEGVVNVVERIRQDKFGGNYFLLPDMNEELYTKNIPLSWLELVLVSFRELWTIKIEKAKKKGKLPEPMSTREIKKFIVKRHGEKSIPDFPGPVSYALGTLAKKNSKTVVRRIRCDKFSNKHLWIPLEVTDKEIDLTNLPISDSVKVNDLVRYAVRRLKRPVTMVDLAKELELRPELTIKRKKSINALLDNQSKCTNVKKVAWLFGEWYFYYGNEKHPSVNAYLALREISIEWKNLNSLAELNDLENCLSKPIAFGRCKLIGDKIEEVSPQLNKLKNNRKFGKEINIEAAQIQREMKEIKIQVDIWLGDNIKTLKLNLPKSIENKISGLTVKQLWKLLQPLYPKAVKVKKVAELSNILSSEIRKIKNPKYKPSFCNGSVETSQYLFDKTDSFTYAGQKWGENECSMQAIMARNNLGLLRDINFVIPGLQSPNYNDRLIAVSCLAFLQDQKAAPHLVEVIMKDEDAGVRESAIWTYAFIGKNIKKLATKIRKKEQNLKVLEFLKKVEKCKWKELWFV